MTRFSTGIAGLDRLIEGGYPEKTTILLSGGPGTGKTLFGLKFLLEGAMKGEKCCYVTLNEEKEDLLRACSLINSLGKVSQYVNKNLAIEHISFDENLTMKKFVQIISSYPKIDRLVIDNANKLLMFSDSGKNYRVHFAELVKYLKRMGCSLLLCETDDDHMDTGHGESFECDGVITLSFLELEEKPMRTIEMHKMRYTVFEPKVPHELVIDKKDIKIGGSKVI
jgi:KaiC/GvpD/RAD55 family RecA-like ATPase